MLKEVNIMSKELHDMLEQIINNTKDEEVEHIKELLYGLLNQQSESRNVGFIGKLLQMERKITGETCEINIPLNSIVNNSLGIVHGGVTATLIDSAMGTLANSLLPEGYGAVTTQLNIHYIAPGIGESLRCEAKCEHKGTKTMVLTATVYRPDNKKVATASGSFFIIEKNSI